MTREKTEVDKFLDKNEGLYVAEIELNKGTEMIIKPSWIGEEITGNSKYYNDKLAVKPFMSWSKNKSKRGKHEN